MALLTTETLCNERQKIIRDLEWTFVAAAALVAGPIP